MSQSFNKKAFLLHAFECSDITAGIVSQNIVSEQTVIEKDQNFCNFGKAVDGLQQSAPKAIIKDGKILNGRLSEDDIKLWIEKIQ